MLLAAFDEVRLACLLSHGCQPVDIPAFLHSCIRSKGFVDPDCDGKRFPPVARQLHRHDAPHDDPMTNAKKAAIAHVAPARSSKEYVHRDIANYVLCSYHFQFLSFSQIPIHSQGLDRQGRQRRLPRRQRNDIAHERMWKGQHPCR